MSDPYLDYWVEAVSCAIEDQCKLSMFDDEELKEMARSIQISHEQYGMAFGHDEADRSCVKRLQDDGAKSVVKEVESLCSMFGDDARFVDYMNDGAKHALATLFNLRTDLRRKGVLS